MLYTVLFFLWLNTAGLVALAFHTSRLRDELRAYTEPQASPPAGDPRDPITVAGLYAGSAPWVT
jgi:hypothetical protein